MSTPSTKKELDARIRTSLDDFLQAIAPLTPAQMQAPTLLGGWSVKDVLVHLAWWDNWLLYTIQTRNTAHIPRTVPALFEKIPARDHWANEVSYSPINRGACPGETALLSRTSGRFPRLLAG